MKGLKKIYNSNELADDKGRIYYFDNLKFILIFLVILGHFLEPLAKTSNYARIIWLFIYFFHMPLFVFISGYFAKKAIKTKDKSKIIIFFVLYIILAFILFAINKFGYGKNVQLSIFTVKNIKWYLEAMGVWYAISMIIQNINKRYVLGVTFILALIIGYDKSFGDYLGLSRIIVFYPFFVLGTMAKEEVINKHITNTKLRIASIISLIIIFVIFILFIDKLYLLRPLLTARNSYFSLNNSIEDYGILLRGLWYIMSCGIGILFMICVPRGKTFFSKFGKRTLSIYFLHAIVLEIWKKYNFNFGVLEYIFISMAVTFILSLKVFSLPFEKMMKIKF